MKGWNQIYCTDHSINAAGPTFNVKVTAVHFTFHMVLHTFCQLSPNGLTTRSRIISQTGTYMSPFGCRIIFGHRAGARFIFNPGVKTSSDVGYLNAIAYKSAVVRPGIWNIGPAPGQMLVKLICPLIFLEPANAGQARPAPGRQSTG